MCEDKVSQNQLTIQQYLMIILSLTVPLVPALTPPRLTPAELEVLSLGLCNISFIIQTRYSLPWMAPWSTHLTGVIVVCSLMILS